MIVLSVCNHKGGTGKTTTAIHVAAALGLSGWHPLVIDLDPQGFLTRAMGVGEPPPDESVAAFFNRKSDPWQNCVRDVGGFDLIPSSSTLTKRMRGLNKPTDVLWIREALQKASLEYDVVLFDTAAAVTVFSLNALVASQHVVIPVLPEYQSVVGSEQTFQTAHLVADKLNPLLRSRMFLLTQVDGRKRIHQTYQEYIRDKYGAAVLDTVIRTSTSLATVQEERATVFQRDPNSRGALDYANATDELVRRIQTVEGPEGEEEASSVEEAVQESGAGTRPGDLLNS